MSDKKKPTFRLRGFSEAECIVVGGDPAGDGSEGGMRMDDMLTYPEEAMRQAADRIAELERDLKSVLDRESATTARYDARIKELERERDDLALRLLSTQGQAADAIDRLAALLKDAGEAVSDGTDALTHALYLLPGDANQRKGMEAALDRMSATLARMKEETDA